MATSADRKTKREDFEFSKPSDWIKSRFIDIFDNYMDIKNSLLILRKTALFGIAILVLLFLRYGFMTGFSGNIIDIANSTSKHIVWLNYGMNPIGCIRFYHDIFGFCNHTEWYLVLRDIAAFIGFYIVGGIYCTYYLKDLWNEIKFFPWSIAGVFKGLCAGGIFTWILIPLTPVFALIGFTWRNLKNLLVDVFWTIKSVVKAVVMFIYYAILKNIALLFSNIIYEDFAERIKREYNKRRDEEKYRQKAQAWWQKSYNEYMGQSEAYRNTSGGGSYTKYEYRGGAGNTGSSSRQNNYSNSRTYGSSGHRFENASQPKTNRFDGLTYDEAKKLYRELCKKCHPDNLGEALGMKAQEEMAQINSEWSEYKKTHKPAA